MSKDDQQRATPKSASSPVLQIMLRKFAAEHKDSGTMADAMRDAADEIDRLNRWADTYSDAALKERALAEARIHELEDQLRATRSEKARWIPVGERFPDGRDAAICLAYTPTDADGDESLGGVLVATHSDEGWQSRTDTGCWEPGAVTHWMPLPEAPK